MEGDIYKYFSEGPLQIFVGEEDLPLDAVVTLQAANIRFDSNYWDTIISFCMRLLRHKDQELELAVSSEERFRLIGQINTAQGEAKRIEKRIAQLQKQASCLKERVSLTRDPLKAAELEGDIKGVHTDIQRSKKQLNQVNTRITLLDQRLKRAYKGRSR